MSGAALQLKVGGHWLTEWATWGDLETVHGWPGDCVEASWTMTSRYRAHHPLIRRDAPVEVKLAGLTSWGGLLQEPEWNGREAQVTVRGWFRAAEDYPAFTSDALATDNPAVAIAAQNARGLGWTLDPSVSNVSMLGTTPDRANTLAALLDAYAEQAGVGWGVNAHRRAYMAGPGSPASGIVPIPAPDPVPEYHVLIGAAELSIAEDSFASHVTLWYLNEHDVYLSVSQPPYADSGPVNGNAYEKRWGHRDWVRDVTDLGNLADADASALALAIYQRGALKPSFTAGVELVPGELVTKGGVRANFNCVRPNTYVRVHGVRDEVKHTPYVDFVIGKITRTQGKKSIALEPVGVAAQSDDDINQELLEEAWAARG